MRCNAERAQLCTQYHHTCELLDHTRHAETAEFRTITLQDSPTHAHTIRRDCAIPHHHTSEFSYTRTHDTQRLRNSAPSHFRILIHTHTRHAETAEFRTITLQNSHTHAHTKRRDCGISHHHTSEFSYTRTHDKQRRCKSAPSITTIGNSTFTRAKCLKTILHRRQHTQT